MGNLGSLSSWLSGMYQGIAVLFVFTLVVFFHELGHFLVARRCGVRVLTFSIGFGPELLGLTDRHGTRWKLAAIPLGGYVKFFGDETAASTPDRAAVEAMTDAERRESFFFKPLAQRAAIVVAGPVANFLLAIVIYASVLMIYGKQEIAARVEEVIPGSAAAVGGFKPGDLVLSVNGKKIESFADMQRIVSISAGEPLDFVVDRGGVQVPLRATPQLTETKDIFGNPTRVGVLGVKRSVAAGDVKTERVGPIDAVRLGAERTWDIVERTMIFLGRLITGRESADQLGGPTGIAMISAKAAVLGFDVLLQVAAMISTSIGLLNLFPIPLLDGGHLLFYAIEAIRGRPLSDRAQEIGFRIGLAIVLMLMVFATFNDIGKLLRLSGS